MSVPIDILTTLAISITAMIVSIIALVYTVRTYLLKSGSNIRGSYGMCSSSVTCEDQYISSLTLENLKDKAVIIFKVYLKIGHSYYLEIEDFDEEPLILKPFEVYKNTYEPIDLYSINMRRINLNSLLSNEKISKKIVISTSDGKYVIRSWIIHWDPVYDFFKNQLTAIIQPRRATFRGKSYGLNAKYIVAIKTENGKEEIIPIYPRDAEIKKFRNFQLTKDSLDTKDRLEEFLYDQVSAGFLNCEEIVVHDRSTWLDEIYESENKETIEAKYHGWFFYNVIGHLITKLSNRRLRRKNKLQLRKSTRKQIGKDAGGS